MGLSIFEDFLLHCGGGDHTLLSDNDIKPDINKVVGIGGAVFFTGLFASFSFGFAMSWVFKEKVTCIFLGIVWGLMIFNLDRLIVSGSIKTSKNSFGYYINFVVRLMLAIGISLIISVPLELKLFESLLTNETIKIEQNSSTTIKEFKQEVNNLEDQYHKETAGKGLTGRIGEGPVAKARKQRLLERENDLKIEQERIRNFYSDNNNNLGLLERFRALESLKKNDKDIEKISLGIMLLFLLVETIPILIKSFSTDAVYEDSIRDKIISVRDNLKNKDRINEIPESKESISKTKEYFQQKILELGIGAVIAACSYYFTKDMNYTTFAGIVVFLIYQPVNNLLSGKS